MAVKSSVDRIYNYDLKLDTETIKKQSDKRRARMLEKQAAAQTELEVLETKAKTFLGILGAPTWTYPAYLNFCREVWKKAKSFNDETLFNEAVVIQAKWAARKLDEDILNRLRHEFFGLQDPKPAKK
jgi:hypothetical protein